MRLADAYNHQRDVKNVLNTFNKLIIELKEYNVLKINNSDILIESPAINGDILKIIDYLIRICRLLDSP